MDFHDHRSGRTPSPTFVSRAELQAAQMGHIVHWDTVGEWGTAGHCTKCGMKLRVARSSGVSRESLGAAVEQRCPGRWGDRAPAVQITS